MKKFIVVVVVIAALVLAGFISWQNFGASWWQTKQEKIRLGLANSAFPWSDRTQEELNNLYPQVKNADVPTRVTPEQTYAAFRQALKDNNLQAALDQLYVDSSRYESNVASITKAYKENKFVEIYGKYPEVLTKSWMNETISQFVFVYDDGKSSHFIDFIKNDNGDWKIEKY